MSQESGLTIMVVSDEGGTTRSLQLTRSRLRAVVLAGTVGWAGLVFLVGSWWYLAAQSRHVAAMEDRVAELVQREAQIEELARTMAEVEAGYERIRALFGGTTPPLTGEIWLPPTTGRATNQTLTPDEERSPTSWPLTERGFVTQTLLDGGGADHPGIDIAVPAGSYIRAAGSGTVIEAGDDAIYGNYLVLDHGDGYRSLYAHASSLFVERGDLVRRNEVIALSGSTGRSTAPHLHFEILLDGEPLDPLTFVTQP